MERFKSTLTAAFLVLVTLVYGETFLEMRNKVRFLPCNISEEKQPGAPLQQCVKIFNLQKAHGDKFTSKYNKLKIHSSIEKKDDTRDFLENVSYQWLFQSISRVPIDKV
jgi:hypothetical protein